jgi:hypothetical protein
VLLSPRSPFSTAAPPRASLARALRRAVVLLLAALLAYAVWQGYRSPDLLLDLAAFRFC